MRELSERRDAAGGHHGFRPQRGPDRGGQQLGERVRELQRRLLRHLRGVGEEGDSRHHSTLVDYPPRAMISGFLRSITSEISLNESPYE